MKSCLHSATYRQLLSEVTNSFSLINVIRFSFSPLPDYFAAAINLSEAFTLFT